MNFKRWGFTPFLIIILSFFVVLTWYNYRFKPLNQVETEKGATANDLAVSGQSADSVSSKTASDLAFESLSTKQKVGLTLAFPLLINDNWSASASADIQPGFITIFGSDIDQAKMEEVNRQLNQVFANQPWRPVLAVDHEGGQVQRLSGNGFTQLESWLNVCSLPQEDRLQISSESASELASSGIGVVFGPVVDLYNSGSSIGSRSCSADPQEVIDRSLELMKAYAQQGILPVIKHYPGIGQSRSDLHQAFEEIDVSEADLQPFLSILNQQPLSGVMVSHVGISDLYSTPCSLTKYCVEALLKGFPKTLVFSDALDMKAVYSSSDLEIESGDLLTPARLALEAGVDVLVFGQGVRPEQLEILSDQLVELSEQEPSFKALIDARARKIWDYRQVYWN